MKIPYPPKPPALYWKLPLVWRQRYCRFLVHPWWSVYNFCDKWVSWKGMKNFVEIQSFRWYCMRADVYDAIVKRFPAFEDYSFRHGRIWRLFH